MSDKSSDGIQSHAASAAFNAGPVAGAETAIADSTIRSKCAVCNDRQNKDVHLHGNHWEGFYYVCDSHPNWCKPNGDCKL